MEILKEAGFDVESAEDGEIAVQKMRQAAPGQYDLILMDIQMPKMDGYEATRQIRALPDAAKAGIPIFAMTANAFEEDRQNALKAGMDGHIAKPLDIPHLLHYCPLACISDGVKTRLGTVRTPYEHFYAWRRVNDGAEV